ncbi:carboxypeptidase regulatory-like domain-containing protein [Spirosoma areae]
MRRQFSIGWVIVCLLACFLAPRAFAQTTTTTLTGLVTDAATGQPMPFVNVYLNTSTRGTITNDKGHFSLVGVPLGTIEVVASFLGYQPQQRTLRLNDDQPQMINFRLKPADQTLAAVTVKANRNDKKWQRQLRQFRQQLLGEPFGGQCQITNPHVLNFTDNGGHLMATATEPLLIENQALGYRLFYDLLHFDGTYQGVFYAGTTRFEAIQAADERQANRFRRNQMRAYLGSTRHLLASLVDSTYEREGFLVYQEDLTVPITRNGNPPTLQGAINQRLLPLKISQLIRPGRLPFERRFVSARQVVVFNTRASSTYSPYRDARYAYSQIRLPGGYMELTVDGVITLPNGMEVQGSLGDDRLSTLLPADWKPTQTEGVKTSPPVATQGKLLPPDARMGRIATAFTSRFQTLAPVLFVHTDKSLYATGDRLWLSAYLLDAATNRRPVGETAIHVDLLTPTGQLVQHQWLRVVDGRAAGDFRLSDTLTSGMYRLRAYTDEDDAQRRPAFERSVAVYNLFQSTAPGEADTMAKPIDVQLLPEGGRWVAGIPSRLGIKLVGPDGHGVLASGRIMDSTSKEMGQFTSNSAGMGSVVMTPQRGQRYYAELLTGSSLRQPTPLPPAEPEGLVLSVDMVSDTTLLGLTITGTNRPPRDSVYVLIQQQGRLVDQRKILLENGIARVHLPVATLPAGLNQLTLYDAIAQPQAERLVFVPQRLVPVRVLISANKTRYQPREQVIMAVRLNDDGLPAAGALSVAITDADQVPDDSAAATIQTHLLLTGELRGRIEQPNSYLRTNTLTSRRALDDLLLTQGWRRVRGTSATELLGGVSVMGRVLNARNEPIAGAQVVLASTTPGKSFVRSAGADDRGRFRLAGLAIADTLRLIAQLTDYRLKNLSLREAHLVQEGPGQAWEPGRTDTLPNWAAWRAQIEAARIRQETNADFYRDKTAKLLKEVIIRARRFDERPDDIRRRSLHNAADATLIFDEKSPPYSNLYEMIRGRLAGVTVLQTPAGGYRVLIRGVSSILGSTTPLFMVDGMPIQDEDGTGLLTFNPGEIERVELLKNAGTTGIYGVRGGNGVVAFYTKTGRSHETLDNTKAGSSVLPLIGYPSVQREFYVPRYETASEAQQTNIRSDRVDRRDVLYWKPTVQTDSQGYSQLIFPLSDVVRTMRVTVQGVTADGRSVVGMSLIRVQ